MKNKQKILPEDSISCVEPRRIELLNPSANRGVPRQRWPLELHDVSVSANIKKRKTETRGLGLSRVQSHSAVDIVSIANPSSMSSILWIKVKGE